MADESTPSPTDEQPEPTPPETAAPAPEADAPPAPEAEAPAAEELPVAATADEAPAAEQPAPARPKRPRKPRNRTRAPRPGGSRPPRGPRERGPLPFDELRAAATTTVALFGGAQALRDAYGVLGDKERKDLSKLVSEDADWRKRARAIAAGSLGAGRVGKALAAQQISMAQIEDLWRLTLSKEEADTRLARVRESKRRDEQRAKRQRDRESSSDRVSRADLKKAQDGRVGAQIRIVIGGVEQGGKPRREERDKEPERQKKGSSVLDRLGY